MAFIRAFKGWRYDPARIKDMRQVVAPPYDVISKKEREVFYRKSPYNVIRLILGKEGKNDSKRNNPYTRARQFLEAWRHSGILIREKSAAVYVYAQDYKEKGRRKTRVGFMAAMSLNEGSVLRHENTLAGPKKDRLALLKEVKTNLSPIFGLFEDKNGGVQRLLKKTMSQPPSVDVRIDGVRHRLFPETRDDILKALSEAMRPKPLFIADGHHRFEVACQFRDWMRSLGRRDSQADWNYVMTYFSDCLHNPFTIFPTHRLLAISKNIKDPLAVLKRRGYLKHASGLSEVLSKLSKPKTDRETHTFGIYTKKGGFFVFALDKKFSPNVKNPVERLDVAVLHKKLIEPCFKIRKIEKSKQMGFTRDADVACKEVRNGRFAMAIFLRPTSFHDMILVSKKGLRMPQKSTYFYPKLLSGLVFHALTGVDQP